MRFLKAYIGAAFGRPSSSYISPASPNIAYRESTWRERGGHLQAM
jgi:hypothetical protein